MDTQKASYEEPKILEVAEITHVVHGGSGDDSDGSGFLPVP